MGAAGRARVRTAPGAGTVTDRVEKACAAVTREVIGIDGVTGTAIGLKDGRSCVKVYLERDDSGLRARVPRSVDGVAVDVEVTGRVRRR